MSKIISEEAIERRNIWVDKIDKIVGHFASNSEIIEEELGKEIRVCLKNRILYLKSLNCAYAQI